MNISGLETGQTTRHLTVKAYGKTMRNEIKIPSIIRDDKHLQEMLFSYAQKLERNGYLGGELPWMVRIAEGVYSDESVVNAGIASLKLDGSLAG